MDREQQRRETLSRIKDPATADNIQVRMALMMRVHNGEITLEQAQVELKAIQRKARKDGKPTAYGSQSHVKVTS